MDARLASSAFKISATLIIVKKWTSQQLDNIPITTQWSKTAFFSLWKMTILYCQFKDIYFLNMLQSLKKFLSYAMLGISIGDEKLHLMAQQLPSQTKMMFGFSDSRFAFTWRLCLIVPFWVGCHDLLDGDAWQHKLIFGSLFSLSNHFLRPEQTDIWKLMLPTFANNSFANVIKSEYSMAFTHCGPSNHRSNRIQIDYNVCNNFQFN